jgi:hypothetical protein
MLCFTECDFSLLLLIGVLLIGGDKYQKMELDIVGVMVSQLVSSEVDSMMMSEVRFVQDQHA